ncbi:unnamed protein product, partial [Larinioides sclopetarius]
YTKETINKIRSVSPTNLLTRSRRLKSFQLSQHTCFGILLSKNSFELFINWFLWKLSFIFQNVENEQSNPSTDCCRIFNTRSNFASCSNPSIYILQ